MRCEIVEPAKKDIYGEFYYVLKSFCSELSMLCETLQNNEAHTRAEHIKIRIKDEDSLKKKLADRGKPVNLKTALEEISDIVGLRIVTVFLDDIYRLRDYFLNSQQYRVIKTKDYIASPKPSGYRSLHMILQRDHLTFKGTEYTLFFEIQLRTLSMDAWAALEHDLQYKSKKHTNEIFQKELKRISDEFASNDLTLSTVRELIWQI